VSRKQALTRGSPNGATHPRSCSGIPAWIHRAVEDNAGKWTISVPAGKENNRDSASSGERTRKSPNHRVYTVGLQGLLGRKAGEWSTSLLVERPGTVGQSGWEPRRRKRAGSLGRFLSTAGHGKSRGNPGGPSPKAKYSLATDSEPVPWGKGEKNPCEGSERVPETVCLQAVGGLWPFGVGRREPAGSGGHAWPRAFCIMSRLVTLSGEAKRKRAGAKASPNRACQSLGVDAKRGDLPLARVKRG